MPGVVSGKRRVLLASFAAALSLALFGASAGEAGVFDGPFQLRSGPPRFYRPPPRSGGSRQGARPGAAVVFAPAARFGRFVRVWRAADRGDEITGAAAGSRPVAPAFCVRRGRAGASGNASRLRQILHDRTLRAGDIVVTDVGIRVFRGAEACPHTWRDFVNPVVADLSTGTKAFLAKLEIAMRAARGDARR